MNRWELRQLNNRSWMQRRIGEMQDKKRNKKWKYVSWFTRHRAWTATYWRGKRYE